jgi:hypothetical protein
MPLLTQAGGKLIADPLFVTLATTNGGAALFLCAK